MPNTLSALFGLLGLLDLLVLFARSIFLNLKLFHDEKDVY
jgi:hypothetical protein